jgi:hypothetical protein
MKRIAEIHIEERKWTLYDVSFRPSKPRKIDQASNYVLVYVCVLFLKYADYWHN